jgi:hypothetical protein
MRNGREADPHDAMEVMPDDEAVLYDLASRYVWWISPEKALERSRERMGPEN